jgi:hypothetical protein
MAQKGCFPNDDGDLQGRRVSQARYTFLRNVGGILPNYITVQNTVLFTVTAVRTLNPTYWILFSTLDGKQNRHIGDLIELTGDFSSVRLPTRGMTHRHIFQTENTWYRLLNSDIHV